MLLRNLTLVLLFLLLACPISFAQLSLLPNLTLEEHQHLKGPVKKVETIAWSEMLPVPYPKTVTFHRNGNVQSTYEVPPGGSEYHSYIYNEREQLLKMEIKMATNGHVTYLVNEYNPEGTLLLTREWNRGGTPEIDTIFSSMTYDEHGRFLGYSIKRISPSGNSLLLGKATYTLDTLRAASGKDTALLARMTIILGNNVMHFDTLYTPDHDLLRITIPTPGYIHTGSSTLITTLYQNMQPVRKEYQSDSEMLSVTAIEYNDSGMVELIRHLPFPEGTALSQEWTQSAYRFEYKYDEYGNWIRKICSASGETKPCMFHEETRVIEYYK